MLSIDKKKVFTLFALTLLITSLLLVNMNIPISAQPVEDVYLHGPPSTPIHKHSNITLKPIHLHSLKGILWPPITDPLYTPWHELYPTFSSVWNLTSWEDHGDPFGELSPNDQIDMKNTETGKTEWFHIDRITITLLLSGPYPGHEHTPAEPTMAIELKWPVYDPGIIDYPMFMGTLWHEVWSDYSNIYRLDSWEDDPFALDGTLSITDSIDLTDINTGIKTFWHVEDVATDLILRWKMMDPISTWWHELYPEYSRWQHLTSWEESPMDDHPGRLGPTDQIDMIDELSRITSWYFVDRLTITINVTDPTGTWMMLELKTRYLDEMYYYLKHPLGSLWHEVYPEYSNVYNLTMWDPIDPYWDNCNGVLDPSDHIELENTKTGVIELYHIEDMAYDLILNKKISDPVSTYWHEIFPEYSNWYHVDGWKDNTWPELLSPSDNVTLTLQPSGPTKEYHVENVTLTLNISSLDFPGEFKLLESTAPFENMYWPKMDPTNYWPIWREVWPELPIAGVEWVIIGWEDNCNGVLDFCDNVTLSDPSGFPTNWHVEEVAIDMVVKLPPEPFHDVAVIDVYSIYAWVYQGEIDPIKVTVENQGTFTETVYVTTYYSGIPAAPMQTITMNPGDVQTLTFNWDTTGVPPGLYQISATAVILIDDDPADNTMLGNWEEVVAMPWYIKPPYPDYAPSAMPDFDQKQDGWFHPAAGWTWCGPTAVANSMWWFDSKYEPNTIPPPTIIDNFPLVTAWGPWDDHDVQNVGPLVQNLAWWMDTDGIRTGTIHTGTYYWDMEWGINQYLIQQGVDHLFEVHSYPWPAPDLDFFYILEEEIYRSQDAILLLEFWDEVTGERWYYDPGGEGGHYVTAAGVNSTTMELLISDPWWDAAEAGFPGHIPVPHPAHGDPMVHNDTQYVSHDDYKVQFVPSPYGMNWELVGYLQQQGWAPSWHAFITWAVFTSPLPGHDVAVTNITTCKDGGVPNPIVTQRRTAHVNVTVLNEGSFTETFNVTAYAGATPIGEQQVTLNPGINTTLTFVWDSTGFPKGNYTISATADTVPGEADIADNTYTDGWILVTKPGDVTGDDSVNVLDLIIVANALWVYNPTADLNDDHTINVLDLILVANNLGT